MVFQGGLRLNNQRPGFCQKKLDNQSAPLWPSSEGSKLYNQPSSHLSDDVDLASNSACFVAINMGHSLRSLVVFKRIIKQEEQLWT